MRDKTFKEVYGSTYEGLKPEVTSLGYSIIFIVRRAVFVLLCLFASGNIWLQIEAQLWMTTFACGYLLHF